MPVYQFLLKKETNQHAVIIMAMRWYIFLPWTGKLSWAPTLTSNSLVCEDEESKKMQMNALKGWFNRQCQPSESALPTYYMSADRWEFSKPWFRAPSLLEMLGTLWFSLLSPFTDIPLKIFFWTKPLPQPFLFTIYF